MATNVLLRSLLVCWLAMFIQTEADADGWTQTKKAEFETIMQALANAWNQGDAQAAAELFSEDAVYSQPPDKQLYQGRDKLYQFFGGANGRPSAMSMTWHHLAYNEDTQIGLGEFSFTYGSTAHGVAVVKIEEGKITNWREYWVDSDRSWKEFVRENDF